MGLGVMLSLVFIGPVFFLLIETSFTRGPKHAIAFDIGVIMSDITCIFAAYYSSDGLIKLIDQHPAFYRITALLMFIYAVYMMATKTVMRIKNEDKLISQNYFKTFLNGYLFNILNIGVVLFWLVTVISVRNNHPKTEEFFIYIGVVILTYLSIDFFKIFLAKQFHDKLSYKVANLIRKIVGGILVIFSIFIFLQSFKKYNRFEERLEESGYQKQMIQKQQPSDDTSHFPTQNQK